MNRNTAILAALLGASIAAHAGGLAPDVVGLHTVSVHTGPKQADGSLGWNNRNPGLYARWDGFTVGAYRNSLFKNSVYAGWTFGDRFAVTVGLASGYDKLTDDPNARQAVRCAEVCRTVNVRSVIVPLVVPSVRLDVAPGVSLRLAAIKAPQAPLALHAMVEHRF